jgi:hypothetical protein
MRLTIRAAAVLVAAAACSSAGAPPPSIALPDAPPDEAREFPVEFEAGRTWLEDRAMRCELLELAPQPTIRCVADNRQSDDPTYLVVDIVSLDGAFVWLLEATVDVGLVGDADLTGFEGFYGETVLGIVVRPEPPAVIAWLREHVATTSSIEVDGLVLEMTAGTTRSTLRAWQRH